MIKEIRLQNFQAHRDTVLELHPGVNVIAGSSNSGKSSVLRGINWAVNNRPSGDAFLSHWAKNEKGKQVEDTSVTLVFDDTSVVRTKSGDTGNTYTLSDVVLEAVGLDVPTEVSIAINFSEVNTQKQHDAPFLLSESPGEVARFFNKIVHFDAIDLYLSSIESKKRKAKSEATRAGENITRLEGDIGKLVWVESATNLLDKLERLDEKQEALRSSIDTLNSHITKHTTLADKLETITNTVHLAGGLIGKVEAIKVKTDKVYSAIDPLSSSIERYRAAETLMETARQVEHAEKIVGRLEKLQVKYDKVQDSATKLWVSLCKLKDVSKAIPAMESEIVELTASLPKTCPTCGKEL